MFTASQIVAHLVGDYLLQSDWMASNKQRSDATGWLSVTLHALMYTLPFLFLTTSWTTLAVICVTHLLIDHYKLAVIVGWVKNFMAPKSYWFPWKDCKGTGYASSKPPFLTVWLLIITDNTLHILINGLSLHYIG